MEPLSPETLQLLLHPPPPPIPSQATLPPLELIARIGSRQETSSELLQQYCGDLNVSTQCHRLLSLIPSLDLQREKLRSSVDALIIYAHEQADEAEERDKRQWEETRDELLTWSQQLPIRHNLETIKRMKRYKEKILQLLRVPCERDIPMGKAQDYWSVQLLEITSKVAESCNGELGRFETIIGACDKSWEKEPEDKRGSCWTAEKLKSVFAEYQKTDLSTVKEREEGLNAIGRTSRAREEMLKKAEEMQEGERKRTEAAAAKAKGVAEEKARKRKNEAAKRRADEAERKKRIEELAREKARAEERRRNELASERENRASERDRMKAEQAKVDEGKRIEMEIEKRAKKEKAKSERETKDRAREEEEKLERAKEERIRREEEERAKEDAIIERQEIAKSVQISTSTAGSSETSNDRHPGIINPRSSRSPFSSTIPDLASTFSPDPQSDLSLNSKMKSSTPDGDRDPATVKRRKLGGEESDWKKIDSLVEQGLYNLDVVLRNPKWQKAISENSFEIKPEDWKGLPTLGAMKEIEVRAAYVCYYGIGFFVRWLENGRSDSHHITIEREQHQDFASSQRREGDFKVENRTEKKVERKLKVSRGKRTRK